MIPKIGIYQHFWKQLLLPIAAWVASFVVTFQVLNYLGFTDQPYSNLIINTVSLLTCIGCIGILGLSAQDLGLKVIRQKLTLHVGLCLVIFSMYWLYYLLAIRISDFRPFTSATFWGVLNYLVVAFAEELFFRGIFFHVVEKRTSGRAAVLITGLLFGLVHFRQGLGMLPKFFTGWLFGSIRYATGMIFLLIFPLHFTYNAVWLLFQGNWENPPSWAYLLPLVELLVAVLISARYKNAGNPDRIGALSFEGNREEVLS